MKKYSTILFLVAIAFSSFAQKYSINDKKAIGLFEKGLNAYEYKKDLEAIEYINKALDREPEFIEAYMIRADIYYQSKNYKESVADYKKAIEVDPNFYPNNYFSLAKAQIAIMDYAGGKESIVEYMRTFKGGAPPDPIMKKRTSYLYDLAKFGEQAIANPVPFEPINLGSAINTSDGEYWPTITADNQLFIFTRLETHLLNTGQTMYAEDFYISEKDENGEWRKAMNMGRPINTRKNEGASCLSPDGQLVFFVACNRESSLGSCDIYVARRSGKAWTEPLNPGAPLNSRKWDSSPSFSSDGKTLYFSSARSGGKGGKDIWKSELQENGAWTNPVSLNISTPEEDISPFIHPDDQTLYFASKGYPGMGGLDLYYSRRQPDGSWGEPTNMGYPINTIGDENGLFVDASGDLAFIASQREGGKGGLDIYTFKLYEGAKPQVVTYAKGKVYDASNKAPLDAKFELIDLETGENVVQSFSDEKTGEFLVTLPVNKDYALNVSKEGYLFYSENFSLESKTNPAEPYTLNVPLQPVKEGGTVVLKNIFFETGKYDLKPASKTELNKLIKFLEANPTVKIEIGGHTDNVGSKTSNQTLSENRAKSVQTYLAENGVKNDRLSYKGYGQEKPIASNDTEEGRAKNRRTEFKVLSK